MTTACCVCLNDIELSKPVRSCVVCIDTRVCSGCFDIMRETNIHERCPVCRCENWSNYADDLLIITDIDPFDSTTNGLQTTNISINITLSRNEEIIIQDGPIQKLCVKIIKLTIVFIVMWSIGFLVLSLAEDNFHQNSSLYVLILGSILAGFIVSVPNAIAPTAWIPPKQ